MNDTPLTRLASLGQSIWYDHIHRAMLNSGELARLVADDDLRGVTSNPTIFEKAITGGDDYDQALAREASANPHHSGREHFFALAIEDIRQAADILRPVYAATGGIDGMVSLEVAPDIAHDTQATIEEARALHQRVDRPNVMIKVPATPAGIPAVEQLINDGISVNVTLLFSVERYHEAALAYLRGLRQRLARGDSVEQVQSVASFFISRVDSLFDKLLDDCGDAGATLKGRVAIANARRAYRLYQTLFGRDDFAELKQAGACPQRLLWASTGTKNPDYSDVVYIENLIGPETVNTVPPATYQAFKDHGQVANTLAGDISDAEAVFTALTQLGVDVPGAMAQLEQEGVAAFANSFENLLNSIEDKARQLNRSNASGTG